ncbi:MAG TPA: hypothetical protein VNN73_03020 [Blastocatellia bacterium]|nr:hypothetical protein [Blastocatellia bacterium]
MQDITRAMRWKSGPKEHPRFKGINFAAYTPENNPQEGARKPLKDGVSHHCWHETMADLSKAIDSYYQKARRHTVNFLEKFGHFWSEGKIHPLHQTS